MDIGKDNDAEGAVKAVKPPVPPPNATAPLVVTRVISAGEAKKMGAAEPAQPMADGWVESAATTSSSPDPSSATMEQFMFSFVTGNTYFERTS